MTTLFVSYRREDNPDAAGRIHDRLESHFGRDSVFFDIDSVPFGVDFRQHVDEVVSKCDVLLVVIGDKWLDPDEDGNAPLADPGDFVRIEIEAALKRDIPVIPVPVGNANVPKESDLPEALNGLAYRNAAEVRSGTPFQGHMDRLIRGIESLLQSDLPAFSNDDSAELPEPKIPNSAEPPTPAEEGSAEPSESSDPKARAPTLVHGESSVSRAARTTTWLITLGILIYLAGLAIDKYGSPSWWIHGGLIAVAAMNACILLTCAYKHVPFGKALLGVSTVSLLASLIVPTEEAIIAFAIFTLPYSLPITLEFGPKLWRHLASKHRVT